MNYDLYLLIKEKLAGEFKENLAKVEEVVDSEEVVDLIDEYQILKKSSLNRTIKENPELCTPNPKDIQFIANNLKEFFPNVEDDEYQYLGIFLNSFIHAYFNSVPEEKRKDLKLYLANTKRLSNIGAELSFGSLIVKETGNYFGREAHGSAILEAEEADYEAGASVYGNAHLIVKKARQRFGREAHGSAILEAEETRDNAGEGAYENAHIIVKEAKEGFGREAHGSAILEAKKAGDCFGQGAFGSAILKAKKVGKYVGNEIKEKAKIIITERFDSIGEHRKDNSQIILPDGRILKAGDKNYYG